MWKFSNNFKDRLVLGEVDKINGLLKSFKNQVPSSNLGLLYKSLTLTSYLSPYCFVWLIESQLSLTGNLKNVDFDLKKFLRLIQKRIRNVPLGLFID